MTKYKVFPNAFNELYSVVRHGWGSQEPFWIADKLQGIPTENLTLDGAVETSKLLNSMSDEEIKKLKVVKK